MGTVCSFMQGLPFSLQPKLFAAQLFNPYLALTLVQIVFVLVPDSPALFLTLPILLLSW